MRKIMALAIVTMFAGASASYALFGLEDVSYDGSIETVGVNYKNEADQNDDATTSDRNEGVNTRVIVGVNAVVTEGVNARVEFTRSGEQYGRRSGASAGAGDGSNANSTHDELSRIAVQNAYLSFADVIWGVSAILGRQYVGEAGDLVWNIAPTDNDALSVGAIDGLTLHRDWEHVQANLFVGKASENEAIGGTDQGDPTGDVNLNSLDLYNTTLIPEGRINFGYLWGEADNGNSTSDANRLKTYRIGVKGGVSEGMFTYRAEFLQNAGEDKGTNVPAGQTKVEYGGSALDLGVGYNSPETEAGKFGVRLGLLAATGDDNATDGDDDSFHDFTVLGVGTSDRIMGEIFGKSSVLSGASATTAGPGGGVDTGPQGQGMGVLNIGASYTPTILDGRLTVNLDFWSFDTAEDGNQTGTPNADEYGDEIDLVLNFAHSENVGIDLGYATFSPGDAITGTAANAPDDDIQKFFGRVKVSWGGEE